MANWIEYKLEDIASVQTGPFGSQLHMKDYVTFGTPIITVEHLGDNRIVHQNLPRITNQDKERLKRYWLQEGDVVFSRVGSVDRRAYVTSNEDGWLFSGRCLRVRADEVKANGLFLSYYFGQESFKEYIRRIAVGATMPSINTSILSEIKLRIPDISTQIKISEILSSLDDKIEVNNQINKNLEALAQALFKQWFVDFEFPNENFQPYKSSGGEMVESESGKIPKGWKIGTLNEMLEVKYGKDHKHLSDGKIPVYGSGGIMRYADQALYREHSILIPRKGTLSNLFYVSEPFWSVDTMFYTIIKETYYRKYLFHTIKSFNLAEMNVGSAVPSMTTKVLNELKVIIPSDVVLYIFEKAISSIFEHSDELQRENQNLELLRNTLLPKLISGELEVSESITEAAM